MIKDEQTINPNKNFSSNQKKEEDKKENIFCEREAYLNQREIEIKKKEENLGRKEEEISMEKENLGKK